MNQRFTIERKPNGPYLVRDLEHLKDWQGHRMDSKPVMALCRCGGSANKPDQNGRSLIECPLCSDRVATRLPSAPRLPLSV